MEKQELTKVESLKPVNVSMSRSRLVSIEKFQKKLNSSPKKGEVLTNKHAGNSQYLPISYVEMTLDELFFGNWRTENFNYQVIANELVGSIELVYVHPVTQAEIRRTGAASVMIQMKSGSSVLDVNNKIKNTLVKDFPHLKASCLTNAARSIGKIFGRDLNRKSIDEYNPIVLPHHNKEVLTVSELIKNAQSGKELEDTYKDHGETILMDSKLLSQYKDAKKALEL